MLTMVITVVHAHIGLSHTGLRQPELHDGLNLREREREMTML